jgi:AsmA protein
MLDLSGQARWQGAANAALQLHGTLSDAAHGNYTTSITLTPANQRNPLLLALKLDGADNHIDLHLPPLALAQWWTRLGGPSTTPQLGVPPVDGSIEMASLDVGGLHVEGLSIRAGDAAPAAAASAAPPAASAAARPRSSARPAKP